MEPIKPPEHNFTYYGPPGTDVLPLDVSRDTDERSITSAWKPSPEELAQLNAGGSVRLIVWMMPPPPVMIDVCGPTNDAGEEADWHGNEIGYTWAETPSEAADDEGPEGLGMGNADEKPSAADVGGDLAAGGSAGDSSA